MFWETIIHRDSQVLEENYLIQLISLDLSLETHALTNSSITHEIYNSSDWGYEVRGVSLDISKALDKVWHDAMFKLEKKDISGNLRDVLPKTKGSVKRTSLSLSKVTTETTQSSNHCSFFLTLMIYQKIYP